MSFTYIDMDTWERRSHFEYYRTFLKCGYSVTVRLDVTNLRQAARERGLRFFPAFVYCVSRTIREKREFRMGIGADGKPGFYDCMHPNYTVFHEDDHTFSDIWSEYSDDFEVFYENMERDIKEFGQVKNVKAKPGQPPNFYCISCVPWLSFTGYSTYTPGGEPALFPIITYGKFEEEDGKTFVPFCINIAHAAADGYHTSVFIERLQEILNEF